MPHVGKHGDIHDSDVSLALFYLKLSVVEVVKIVLQLHPAVGVNR